MDYRKDIDGLRGVAVIAVIANHLPAAYLPSGFLGVDVFFVISGFVITASLLNHSPSSLSGLYTEFFSKRVKRLLPALFVFVLLTSAYVLLVDPFPKVSIKTGIASLFGLSNIVLYSEQLDYFSASSKFNAFTHTWSLGVEEQFYLVFPLVIWLGFFKGSNAKSIKKFALILFFLSVASLIAFVYLYDVNQPAAYFLTPMRIWELGAGSLACLVSVSAYSNSVGRILSKVSILLLLLLLGIFFLSLEYAMPATVVAILLTFLIILSPKESFSSRVLSIPLAVFIGKISYSLYLWHWPVITLKAFGLSSFSESVFLYILVMLSLAILSFYFIENPLRHRKWSSRKGWDISIGIILGFMIGLSIYGGKKIKKIEVEKQYPAAFLPILSNGKGYSTCVVDGINGHLKQSTFSDCTEKPKRSDKPMLWVMGDSHAGHLQGLLYDMHNKIGTGVHLVETVGMPFPVTVKSGTEAREALFQSAYSEMTVGDLVLIPRLYFNRGESERGLRGNINLWLSKIPRLAESLLEKNVKLILIGPTPIFRSMEDIRQCTLGGRSRCSVSRSDLKDENNLVLPQLRQLAEKYDNVFLYEPFSALCPSNQARCYADDGRLFLYRDKDHLNSFGSTKLTLPFIKFLRGHDLLQK
jgi:peptidoglycan/LPS O-acetylase OafA/YrhL